MSKARGCQSPERLTLKDGAVVMFTRNDPDGRFVNGTTGVVVEAAGAMAGQWSRLKDGSMVTAEPMAWEVIEPEPEERDIGRPKCGDYSRASPRFRSVSAGRSRCIRPKACRWTRP